MEAAAARDLRDDRARLTAEAAALRDAAAERRAEAAALREALLAERAAGASGRGVDLQVGSRTLAAGFLRRGYLLAGLGPPRFWAGPRLGPRLGGLRA